jgi:hypothetical protein
MKSSQDQKFSVVSYADIDIGEFDDGRPPRSAKFVADIDFGSGPGGGDYRTYFLCTDKMRSGWYLWLRISDYDTGKPIYSIQAYGSPYRGYSAQYASEQLLRKVLEDQNGWGWLGSPPWHVMKPGLLDTDDIQRIGFTVSGAD